MSQIKQKTSVEVQYNEPKDTLNPIPQDNGFYPVKGIYRNDDISLGTRSITIKLGDDIQGAINSMKDTGGIIHLANGVHYLTNNIDLYSGVYLTGESADSTVLDFQNNAYGIRVAGTNVYNTGTVSVTNNGTSLTGIGTTWTSSMVGRNILIGGIWYPIVAFVSTTNIYIGIPYAGTTLSGVAYTIASMVDDIKISDLTIKNASYGIYIQYSNEIFFRDLNIQTSVYGIYCIDSSQLSLHEIDVIVCNSSYLLSNAHYNSISLSSSIDSQTGNGFTLSNTTNTTINSYFVLNSFLDGLNITDCTNITLAGVTSNNKAHGINFVSNNKVITFSSSTSNENTKSGIYFGTNSNEIHVNNCSIHNNSTYGVIIADISSTNNFVTTNTILGNSTAQFLDNGTGTISANNILV